MLVLLGVWIVMVAGYASAETPADVNGTWVGSTLRGAATMTLVLKQTANNVKRTIAGAGTADGPMDGTVDGDTIAERDGDHAASSQVAPRCLRPVAHPSLVDGRNQPQGLYASGKSFRSWFMSSAGSRILRD